MKKLHNYQLNAIKFILDKKKCALFLDMGLGKTIITLTALNYLIKNKIIKKALIIAPLRVANTVWKQEAENWNHLKDLKFSIITGNIKNKISALQNEADIYITNRENTEWLVNYQEFDYCALIVDESSSFKSNKTKRFKALKKVTKNLKYSILLTGTPISNGYLDLWSQYYLLDCGNRLGKSMTAYKNRFFNESYTGLSYDLKPNADVNIKNLIKDITLTMKISDHIDLPNKIIINQYAELDNEDSIKYKKLEKDFIVELKKDTISVINSAVLSNKLLQFCNGAIYNDTKEVIEIHDKKLELLKSIIEENPNENYIIAYNYRYDIDRIINYLNNEPILFTGEESIIKQWNDKKIKILLCHPKSSGHGLNLQYGGNIILWYGLNWSLELYQQFNSRIYRQGQSKAVRIIHLLIKNSIEDKLLKSLTNKNITQTSLLNYLKEQY